MVMRLLSFLLGLALCVAPSWSLASGPNLARQAVATASETQGDLTPDKAIDGNGSSRWSGIPGHNAGVWFELDWPKPVQVGEVVIRQYDRFVMEFDLQTWDESASKWVTIRHVGRPGERLTRNVLCRIAPTPTSRLRLANITNGPSFTELEVYSDPKEHPADIELASDLRGNFVGMVTDTLGASPVEGASVELSGESWHRQVATDHYGMFSCPMPLGLKGTVTARSAGASRGFPAQAFSYGLTAHNDGPSDLNALDGTWKFRLDPPSDFASVGFDDSRWAKIRVPGHWEMQGFRSLSGVGGYRRSFVCPPGPGRLKLRFEGVYSRAEVYVNCRLVATHEGGFTPFEADITAATHEGRNVLALRVSEHTVVSDDLDHMSQYADFPLTGITRKVTLFRVPDLHIGWFTYATHLNSDGSATVSGEVTILNESWRRRTLGPIFMMFRTQNDADGTDGRLQGADVGSIPPWSRVDVPYTVHIRKPLLWNAEHPDLYRLHLSLTGSADSAEAGDYSSIDPGLGLREVRVRGTEILINGKPVKFRGTCHHDSDPLLGRADDSRDPMAEGDPMAPEDSLMREANINAIRTSHYPPAPTLLDHGDGGFYVEDEADFCWVDAANDLRNAPRIIQLTAEMVARDRNHACVFDWSLCNESEYGYDFERSHDFVRTIDPSRPTSAATSAWTEIATLHNPISVRRIQENEGIDKPMLFDESLCIYQGIWNDAGELWIDPGIRDYYVDPLIQVDDAFMKSKTTQGSMIWCWADDLFAVPGRGLEYGRNSTRNHFVEDEYALPGRGIVGDAPWGVVDGWRRPKPEYWHVKKLYSPVKVAVRSFPIPAAGQPIRIPVQNEYDFTNLCELKILAWAGHRDFTQVSQLRMPRPQIGRVSANVPARSSGEILLWPKRRLRAGEQIDLTFWNRDELVDYDTLTAGAVVPSPPPSARSGGSLKVFDENVLAGVSTHVLGDHFELAFDRGTGSLRRCVASGQPLLLGVPEPHILLSGSPLTPVEDAGPAKIENQVLERQGSDVLLKMDATFGALSGQCEMRISPSGEVTVDSLYVNNGPDVLAREVGVRLDLPRECQCLVWDRNAEWSAYPSDHIGRPHGEASAFPPLQPLIRGWVKRPWALDPSPMGINDFRSTKRHVNWVWLGATGSPGLAVVTDGKQSARAIVGSDRVSLHINDWYGGTCSGLGEWVSNYGSGKRIRHGETIVSHLVLRLGADQPK